MILTGHDDRDLAQAALRAGAVAYVLKAREPKEIFGVIMDAASTW